MDDHGRILPYASLFGRDATAVIDDLESYARILQKWQHIQNLVSRETLPDLWARHFADSLQLLKYLRLGDAHFIDLGSGGGFPALPLAIATKGQGRHFTLLEPNARKVSFLRTVTRELGLDVEVIGARSDEFDSRETTTFDIITSRALAALPTLCSWMRPHFSHKTRALLHKGREHVDELAETRARWQLDVLIHPSETDPGGVILEIANLSGQSER